MSDSAEYKSGLDPAKIKITGLHPSGVGHKVNAYAQDRIPVPSRTLGSEQAPTSPSPPKPVEASPPHQNPAADDDDDVYRPAPKTNPVVDALIKAGLYGEARGDRRHQLVCPWACEHGAEEGPYEAIYTEPDNANPIGRFDCSHAHAVRYTATSLIEHLHLTPAVARARPRIRVSPGEGHLAAAAAEKVLAATGSYFHSGGPIVRIVDRFGVGVMTDHVNDQTLSAILSAKIDWERKTRGGEWVRCDPPASVVQALRHGQDRLHLLPLSGLARQPFYGPDHRLITTPGYDAGTGTYGIFDNADYPLQEPTRENAERSLQYLSWLLREFPFASEVDKSAALAAMLTAAVRPSLAQAPAFSVSATRSGSGKSYLASLIALMAGPGQPFNVSYPSKADEATKVVLAMLLEKPAVILFDDMQTDWKSFGALNKALTSATTTERLLGSSRTATARTNVLFLGTGNNIEPEHDMRRRVVSIRLAPLTATPTLTEFAEEGPVEHTRKRRGRVVSAALTIIEAFHAAGRPKADVSAVGTFEEWSTYCRQSLLWLDQPDPAGSLIEQVTNDSDQQVLEELLGAWHGNFGSRSMTVRKVVETAERDFDLRDILFELPILDGRGINPNKLGWYLKHNRGRRAGGLRIEPGEHTERRAWRVLPD